MTFVDLDFRTQSTSLSRDNVMAMLQNYNFFSKDLNENGQDFKHIFKVRTIKDDNVIFDRASDLIWQQGGSPESVNYATAKKYVTELNQKSYGGYHDWRLPTMEEAMSLMEPKKKRNNLYIDSIFDATQHWIWTFDQVQGASRAAWVVSFYLGHCYWGIFDYYDNYVRAVRSG